MMDDNDKKRKVGRINCGFLDYNVMKIPLKRNLAVDSSYLKGNSDYHLIKISEFSKDDDPEIFKGGRGIAAVHKAQTIQRSKIFENPTIGQKKNANEIYAKTLSGHPNSVDIKNMEEHQQVLEALYGHYETELERKIIFEKDIVTILNSLKLPVGSKGFLYIKDTILYCFKHGLKSCKISSVYEIIGKAYGVSAKTVEKSTRSVLCVANYYKGLDNIKKHLGMEVNDKYPPTNCEFIFGCINILPYLLIQLNKEKKEREEFKIYPQNNK